jgi:hypothetical protein
MFLKMAVSLRAVWYILTDVSEVITAFIIRAMTHHPDDKAISTCKTPVVTTRLRGAAMFVLAVVSARNLTEDKTALKFATVKSVVIHRVSKMSVTEKR